MGRQGSGVVSLQTIMLLLEIGRRRREHGKTFILAAEEPELHLHPGHHRRLVARLRGVSDQTIVTTHSPEVAAYHRSHEILIVQNTSGAMTAKPMLDCEPVPERNALLRLFTVLRRDVCEALMHNAVVVPEGVTEAHWFRGLLRACVTAEGAADQSPGDDDALFSSSLGVLPTQSSSVLDTYTQFRQVIPHLLPLADGDSAGREYVKKLLALRPEPERVARLADGFALESVVAWILEPLAKKDEAWAVLRSTIEPAAADRASIEHALTKHKTRWDLHDELLAAIASSAASAGRARSFLDGLARIAVGRPASDGWAKHDTVGSTELFVWSPPEPGHGE